MQVQKYEQKMCQNSKVAKREKRERGDQRPETTDHKKATIVAQNRHITTTIRP